MNAPAPRTDAEVEASIQTLAPLFDGLKALAKPRQACVTRQSFEALEGAEEIERELLDTPLGVKLVELLALAQDADHKAARKEAEHVQNGRRYLYHPTMEARLAEKLLNLLGSADDCFVVRELAERAVS